MTGPFAQKPKEDQKPPITEEIAQLGKKRLAMQIRSLDMEGIKNQIQDRFSRSGIPLLKDMRVENVEVRDVSAIGNVGIPTVVIQLIKNESTPGSFVPPRLVFEHVRYPGQLKEDPFRDQVNLITDVADTKAPVLTAEGYKELISFSANMVDAIIFNKLTG